MSRIDDAISIMSNATNLGLLRLLTYDASEQRWVRDWTVEDRVNLPNMYSRVEGDGAYRGIGVVGQCKKTDTESDVVDVSVGTSYLLR